MRHQISVDPPDHAGINISDLEEVVETRITGSTTAVQHLPHPPILLGLFARQKVMLDNDRHARFHVQKDWTIFRGLAVEAMVNGQKSSTGELQARW